MPARSSSRQMWSGAWPGVWSTRRTRSPRSISSPSASSRVGGGGSILQPRAAIPSPGPWPHLLVGPDQEEPALAVGREQALVVVHHRRHQVAVGAQLARLAAGLDPLRPELVHRRLGEEAVAADVVE